LENESRLEQIRPIILFLIKKSLSVSIKKFDELDMPSKKFNITEALKKRMICYKDHSNLYFFMWSICPRKTYLMRNICKSKGEHVYNLTINNIEHFRAALLVFLFQHIMFIKYYDFDFEKYTELFNAAIKDLKCVFCLFDEYIELISMHLLTKEL
jgi:hypothetical protein